jgi:NarL family two-component system response regulator LiaR
VITIQDTVLAPVLAEHNLVCKYLINVLGGDGTIRPIQFEEMGTKELGSGPMVFVIDLGSLSLSLAECVRRLSNRFTIARYVVVCQSNEGVQSAGMLRCGIHGIVPYDSTTACLQRAVHKVAEGKLWVANETFRSYVELTARFRNSRREPVEELTPRETEILELARQRRTNKEIASMLNVRECTVKYHLSNSFGKLGIAGRLDLVDDTKRSRFWTKWVS